MTYTHKQVRIRIKIRVSFKTRVEVRVGARLSVVYMDGNPMLNSGNTWSHI